MDNARQIALNTTGTLFGVISLTSVDEIIQTATAIMTLVMGTAAIVRACIPVVRAVIRFYRRKRR